MEQKTYPVLPIANPKTLIIWCGDPRIQGSVNNFLQDTESGLGLKYGEYIPITVLGGVASFSEPLSIPKEFKFMKESAKFCFEHFSSLERIILINHEDCLKYKAISEKLGSSFLRVFGTLSNRQLHDLAVVGKLITDLSPHHMEFDRYYGKFANAEHTQLFFEKQ